MRFVRTKLTKQKVVEIEDIPSIKVKTETAFIPESVKETRENETESTTTSVDGSDESTEEETIELLEEIVSTTFPRVDEDSTKITSEEALDITYEALRAEKNGTRSFAYSMFFLGFLTLTIFALIIAFSMNYSPVGFIVAILFSLLAIASLITSFVLGIKSLRAPYNTLKGRRRATTGLILSSIFLALFFANILFGIF